MTRRRMAVLALGTFLTFPALAAAQAPSPPPSPSSAANRLFAPQLRPGVTFNDFQARVVEQFRSLSTGTDAISAADLPVHEAFQKASARTILVTRIMQADLDGDGAVTVDEMRRMIDYQTRFFPRPPAPASPAGPEHELVRDLLAADADQDGRVTWAEAIRWAASKPDFNPFGDRIRDGYRYALALDADGDGRVTLAEFRAAAEALFRAIDTDGNGTISEAELQAFRQSPQGPPNEAARQEAARLAEARERARQERQERARQEALRQAEAQRKAKEEAEAKARAPCVMPKASERAKIMLLSAARAEALSTTTIATQDAVVETGTVEVEPGEEPLYVVVVSSRPAVWRFVGATDRVERLVLAGTTMGLSYGLDDQMPLVGATGIPADRVTFLGKPDCMRPFTEAPSLDAAKDRGAVERDAGREPAVMAGRYAVSGFSVPSGRITSLRDGGRRKLIIQKSAGDLVIEGDASNVIVQTGRRDLAKELGRDYPGGVVEIDPNAVVSSRPAERYEVLPLGAGLLQLLDSGALSRNEAGEFLVHRKIRFPAGLNGGLSVDFLVLRGVPEPEGDPGHSNVILEETGLPWRRRQ